MAKEETDNVHDIQIAVSPKGARLWKNVKGLFWTLDRRHKIKGGIQVAGAADLWGFTPEIVTPEWCERMMGKKIAIFTIVEVKSADGTAFKEQRDLINFVLDNGGYAGVARTPADAFRIMHIPQN